MALKSTSSQTENCFSDLFKIPAHSEWGVVKHFLADSTDSWEKTRRILIEVQKRCLAEQVILLSWDQREKICKVLDACPNRNRIMLNEDLQLAVMRRGYEEKRILQWKDLWSDDTIRKILKRHSYHTLLVCPVTVKETLFDALVLINYSGWGDGKRIFHFLQMVSSIMNLSLENFRLQLKLNLKNTEVKNWAENVERRIEEGTKSLLEREFQYFALFEGTHDGIIVHDPDGHFIELNHPICRLLGYNKKELLEKTWSDLVPADIKERLSIFFNGVLKKEINERLEIELFNRENRKFDAELSSRHVRFRSRDVIQTYIRDISLQKKLELSLRESKEKYRILVESSLIGVFITRSGTLQFVNTAFERILGIPKDELLGQNLFEWIAPEQRKLLSLRELQREEGQTVPDRYEVQFVRRDKKTVWCELHSRRLILDDSVAILGNVIDITHKKRLERQIVENQKMESIGTLAGGIAHDFNNLLGGILGYASLLMSDMTTDHPFYKDIESIAETAKRAAELTSRLLAFARGGKYQDNFIQLNNICHSIATRFIAKTGINIETSLNKQLWQIRGDTKQIKQTIENIVSNAVEAMPDGGTLRIITENLSVPYHLHPNPYQLPKGDYVHVIVADTGIGMDDGTLSRIFEPFFTTNPNREGAGLGLAMVYGVIKNHAGFIHVDSMPHKGTQMHVFLPKAISLEEDVTRKPQTIVKGKHKILLVDDERVIREVGRRMLEKGGYDVILASNGKEALDIYRKNMRNIDLVLLDWIMPIMGGKETYRQLKDFNPKVRIGITSGYGFWDRPDLIMIEEKHFIPKPFHTDVLIGTVKNLLKSEA